MIFTKFFLVIFLFFTVNLCNAQNEIKLTSNEQAYLKVFNDFLTYINKENKKNTDSITHSSNVDFLLANYILIVNFKSDTTGKTQELNKIRSEIKNLYSFFGSMNIDNIKSQPLRLYDDKYVYTKLSPYQQNNTFVFFDKASPQKVLGYILFVPGDQIKSNWPKILSWKLVFSYGTFFFEDILGQKGSELFFEGVKKSSDPVSL